MFSLIGSAFFFAKVLGIAIVFVALLAALLYHLGWRNDHPDGFWPLYALLGFGGVILAGTGLIIGSILAVVIGVVAYFCALLTGRRSSA